MATLEAMKALPQGNPCGKGKTCYTLVIEISVNLWRGRIYGIAYTG